MTMNVKPFTVDFSGVSDSKFDIPQGKYLVKVKGMDRKESSNGNPQLVFELEVISGEVRGRTLRHYITLTHNSLWVLRNFLEAMGFSIPKSAVTINPSLYIGKILGVDIGERTGTDGKTYPTVKDVFRPTGAGSVDSDDGF